MIGGISVIGLSILPGRSVTWAGAETVRTDKFVVRESVIERILLKLRPCESGWNDRAVNPEDLDGSPSWGRYQMKPSTMLEWGKKHNLISKDIESAEIMNLIFDGYLQENILIEELKLNRSDKDWWMHQFPGCATKYRFWEYK